MKLNDDFFRILGTEVYQDNTKYFIRLDAGHSIYNDHFPENPVTPGVCIIQMVKELTAEKLNCPLFLHKIARVRYYKAINPIDNELITVSLNVAEKDGHYDVSATVSSGETVFSELSLMFTNG